MNTMWTCKFRARDKNNSISKIMKRNNVNLTYYPVNTYCRENRQYYIATAIVSGEEKNVRKFYSALKKLKNSKTGRRLEYFENENN